MQHPQLDEHNQPVFIQHAHSPSVAGEWGDAAATATATPGCAMPKAINRIDLHPWQNAPRTSADWEALASVVHFNEPRLPIVAGKKQAAGAVTIEPDDRVWIVAPTNAFGGYAATFPKGKTDHRGLRATAIREAFEESGLYVELTGYLCDSIRSTSITRYYTARRIGGGPAAMGWESQAVILAPADSLAGLVTHDNDRPVVQATLAHIHKGT